MNDDYERLQLQTKKKYVLDTELRSFIRMTAGMECHEIPLYPETITTPLLRRLVEQEGAGISQLARLTGLARGDIRRRLL